MPSRPTPDKRFALGADSLNTALQHSQRSKEQAVALTRKGSRLIVVEGDTYRWRIRHKLSYCQGNGWMPLMFAVEDATVPGTTLVIRTNQPHPGN